MQHLSNWLHFFILFPYNLFLLLITTKNNPFYIFRFICRNLLALEFKISK